MITYPRGRVYGIVGFGRYPDRRCLGKFFDVVRDAAILHDLEKSIIPVSLRAMYATGAFSAA